jgi:hypothetical protein
MFPTAPRYAILSGNDEAAGHYDFHNSALLLFASGGGLF